MTAGPTAGIALASHRAKGTTMTRENSMSADEAAVRAVIDAITNAVRAEDVEALLSHCAPDIATFDMVPPLKHEGAEAIRRLWAKTLAMSDLKP